MFIIAGHLHTNTCVLLRLVPNVTNVSVSDWEEAAREFQMHLIGTDRLPVTNKKARKMHNDVKLVVRNSVTECSRNQQVFYLPAARPSPTVRVWSLVPIAM